MVGTDKEPGTPALALVRPYRSLKIGVRGRKKKAMRTPGPDVRTGKKRGSEVEKKAMRTPGPDVRTGKKLGSEVEKKAMRTPGPDVRTGKKLGSEVDFFSRRRDAHGAFWLSMESWKGSGSVRGLAV